DGPDADARFGPVVSPRLDMIRTLTGFLILSSLAAVAGCGGQGENAAPASLEVGPHQGVAHLLPGDRGYLEVVNEPEPADIRSPTPTAIVLYFLDPSGKAAMAAPPTEVTVKVNRGPSRTETVPLRPEPKSDDPAGSARFASKTGAFALAGLRG